MTNNDMWYLIKGRTRAFYERVFKPFNPCKKNDLKRIENFLKLHFLKIRSHSAWASTFLGMMDDAETDIALHKREPKPFEEEIQDLFVIANMSAPNFRL